MIHLLDVNLLIALLDPHHVHNKSAHRWISALPKPTRWATCPLTENAFVRITGSPSYPNSPGSASAALALLSQNCSQVEHSFWADDISLRDKDMWDGLKIMRASDLTDLYLLALAVKHKGKLASFDRQIPAHLIRGGREALLILPG
ncbi:MAG: hypothetical protein LV480_09595 [Methylacidiphilales bacterium]|nr:hypothetical protein [Candidatus Methylacidiphilales bacterium]